CTAASSRAALDLAAQYDFLYAAVGIHPENCAGVTDADFAAVEAMAKEDKAVAIGEIGLDYYWEENPPRDFQKEVFARQLALAEALDLPVIVHDRDAHGDCLDLVRAFPNTRGVFHCYSGAIEEAKLLLDRGWYLGFDGPVTFKNARRAPEVVRFLPLDRLLLETDSPYMAPVPHRGKRNDSRNLPFIAAKIAELKGLSPEAVEQAAWDNANRFFGLEG
ncbi:MAG TPA: TatD family hydrolase, partial [Firmicutes bacterium]|nr:TatD family hydrolase [Bacillota bacterium]